MRVWRPTALVGALAVAAGSLVAQLPAASAHGQPHTFAVIGDIPYGDQQLAQFPAVVGQINEDPAVRAVVHLGDIKSGSTLCSDAYFQAVRADFDRFEDPLVYAPGDNEWTDCHRPNNGGYDPLERLGAIRDVFFDAPGRTLGRRSMRVLSQADRGLPENVRWTQAGVGFAALHVVGSNNGLAPWTGNTTATPEQTVEVLDRTAAVIQEIDETFAEARRDRRRAVVLLLQADMFDPTVSAPSFSNAYGFQPIVAAIARQSARFDGPVYLFNGDSHVYNQDQPLATGSPWLSFYRLSAPVPNLTRVTVDGSTNADEYLRVTVNRRGPVLTWDRVPFDPTA